jgi:hypothetical protein
MASANQNGETELLMKINQRLPAALQARFDELMEQLGIRAPECD